MRHVEASGSVRTGDRCVDARSASDPRSIDAFIDAMGQPAVQDIAVSTLKKLSAIRERIDETFNALRDVEGRANAKKRGCRR